MLAVRLTITSPILVFVACSGPGLDLLTSWSPQHTYEVRVSGDFGLPVRPFTKYEARLDVRKAGGVYVRPVLIHEADALDTSFGLRYTSQVWPQENIFQLKSGTAETNHTDKLVVENRSGQAVKQLVVNTEDLVLFLDIQPNAVAQISVSAQRVTEFLWVAARATMANSRMLKSPSTAFHALDAELDAASHYTLIVTVESEQISLAARLPDGGVARTVRN